jgi:hypothetical protein
MSTAEARATGVEWAVEAAAASVGELRPGPGVRIVDGRAMYSAAWLDFEHAETAELAVPRN